MTSCFRKHRGVPAALSHQASRTPLQTSWGTCCLVTPNISYTFANIVGYLLPCHTKHLVHLCKHRGVPAALSHQASRTPLQTSWGTCCLVTPSISYTFANIVGYLLPCHTKHLVHLCKHRGVPAALSHQAFRTPLQTSWGTCCLVTPSISYTFANIVGYLLPCHTKHLVHLCKQSNIKVWDTCFCYSSSIRKA